VLRTLHRWHDVEVRLADGALGDMPFTGELTDASFSTSIELVSRSLGLRALHEGEAITLDRAAAVTRRPARGELAPHPP
jgi:hypothetical protein